MKEYIEREAAIKLFNFAVLDCLGMEPTIRAGDIIKALESIPAADVREMVKAKIIDMRYAEDDGEWKCSRCGWQYTLCVCGKDVTSKIHFCPNCGAEMKGEAE